ncbi:MAG: ester cyclase [Gallionella sp.]
MITFNMTNNLRVLAQVCIVVTTAALSTVAMADNSELARYQMAEKLAKAQIAAFDTLDFDVFTNQKWDRLHESHSKDVIVHWPDGHQTRGIERHIEDLKAMFVYAPDTRIQEHPVKVAQGEWTSVIGIMEGTFTKPMPIGDGKTIAPTGKSFKLIMCTVGHWKDGVMDEEYLFWDNQSYMKQIGLAQ